MVSWSFSATAISKRRGGADTEHSSMQTKLLVFFTQQPLFFFYVDDTISSCMQRRNLIALVSSQHAVKSIKSPAELIAVFFTDFILPVVCC